MITDDTARIHALRLLERQVDMTAFSARRFAEAARAGDLGAARRWRQAYQLSSARCRALGRQARGEPDRGEPGQGKPERGQPGHGEPEHAA